MSQTSPASRRRRADAQRNYERLLSVARAAVDERGRNIVLEDIAKDAGVAIGTLYNHFPTRQALFQAVFLDEAQELRALAENLADEPGPLDALIRWLRLQLEYGARGRSMGAAVMHMRHVEGSEIQLTHAAMHEAGTVLLRRAQAAGEVRPGIELVNVLRLILGILLANEQSPSPDGVVPMFDILIAGIRT
ncbi:MAG: TetR/AcrR family transcriptional regulator [Streptosporangiaceae bacterium]